MKENVHFTMQRKTIYKSFNQNNAAFRTALRTSNVFVVYSLSHNMFNLLDFWTEYSMFTILYSFTFKLLYIALTFQTLNRYETTVSRLELIRLSRDGTLDNDCQFVEILTNDGRTRYFHVSSLAPQDEPLSI